MYGEGISQEGDLLDLAVDNGIVQKSGAWFSYGEERLGQGREKVRTLLKEDRDIFGRIEKEVKIKLGMIKPDPVEERNTKESKKRFGGVKSWGDESRNELKIEDQQK